MTRLEEFKEMLRKIDEADSWDAYPEYFEKLCDWYDIDIHDNETYGDPQQIYDAIEEAIANEDDDYYDDDEEEENKLYRQDDDRTLTIAQIERILTDFYQTDGDSTSGCSYNGRWLSISDIMEQLSKEA